ncbi:hypothetical protein RND81_10G060900 [Saponaria officinalis]|uniref:Protein RIK n=2 Tax=Saponaria officinalis TaxID=3572 RepID=A0AAW1HY87_SAPOF
MAENDNLPMYSSDQLSAATETSMSKRRKKRKWDQPVECLSSSAVTSGLLSMPTAGYSSVSLPGILPIPALTQAPLLQLQASVVAQKLNKPKIQEDLVIAREIVINDADPAMRYKLTKRQTQEEIQKCTGAVVITRGKYRPPNAIPNGEKPLYLHISSGAHLKETAECVLAVDRAAAMVEDLLKQVTQPLSTCVYVGFDADPSLNIAARIRGPNDQYINHIINVTGATVVLRGHRSGYMSGTESEEGQQPLHLFLSSNNQKSLEDARLLAENLLDTISRECGATRVSSCKLYGAVPPPQQSLVGAQSSGLEMYSSLSTAGSLSSSAATTAAGVSNSLALAPVVTGGLLPASCSQTNRLLYSQPFTTACTSYSAYAGIYPQAIPLEQVALALKQSGTVTSTVAPTTVTTTVATGMVHNSSSNAEKRHPQKRKFQEAPATLILAARSQQQVPALHDSSSGVKNKIDVARPCTSVKTQQHLASCQTTTNHISSKSMPPPPSPSKFSSSTPSLTSRSMLSPKLTSSLCVNGVSRKDGISNMPNLTSVSDTLIKLMEYGDGDDDDDEVDESEHQAVKTNTNKDINAKPFWAA